MKNIDNRATIEAIRAKYGSFLEFCRQANVHPQALYPALLGKCGGRKKNSNLGRALDRLREENLLIQQQ